MPYEHPPESLWVFKHPTRGYWSSEKEKWVKDRQQATVRPWHEASLVVLYGVAKKGKWEPA